MIVITGSAGFIGSCVLSYFNQKGHEDIIIVDDFSRPDKAKNIAGKKYQLKIHRDDFIHWFENNPRQIHYVIHLGARTDTTEFDETIFDKLNINYSKDIWKLCTEHQIPLIYASSAATYGSGEHGYQDNTKQLHLLKPLNPYGWSKHKFDCWAVEQSATPPFWAGLKFFNVFGPNEYHKGRMASVVFHAFNQIQQTGKVKLFRSHRPDFKDGEQLRDFVYIKDVVKVIYFIYSHPVKSDIYNLGTGKARTFLDLAKSVFRAMNKPENIEFIDTPQDIRDKYQYFTQANMQKLIGQGYAEPFTALEDAVGDYVSNYLLPEKYY
ncbi:MAG: ADP-L-glycero-D-manno-heptose-6-epimerase [Bacteroidia bacterium]|nr:MAG: ADP-L-glycero-D-manno-heptose-6-epimerase [Bacteroidia bacterium]